MELLINDDQQLRSHPFQESQLNQGIQSTLLSMMIEMQKSQIETNTKLDHFFKYFSNNPQKQAHHIESFSFFITASPQFTQDKISPRRSSSYSPCKRPLLSSKSFKLSKSPEYFLFLKRFTEDDKYVNEGKTKSLYRNNSENIVKGIKKEIATEDNEEKRSVQYNNTSHRTSETTRSNNSTSKGKIRGFNFRNKIGTNNYNYSNSDYHSQPRRRATCDLFTSNQDIYDPFHPTNMMLTHYTATKNDSETGNSKPQIVSEKKVKRYWNIQIAKPNKLQQKLKENFAKMINTKRLIE